MHGLSLIGKEEGLCIIEAINSPTELDRKHILRDGLKNVVEVTSGGENNETRTDYNR